MHVPHHPCLCMACPVQCILARSKTPCQSPATTWRLSLNRRKRAPNVSHILRKFFGALGNNRAGKWQTHCCQFSNVTIARAELQEQNLETADRGSLAEEVWQRKASLMLLLTLLVTSLKIPASYEDVVIDLSKAELDEETGNFCVVQKVGGLLSACNQIACN